MEDDLPTIPETPALWEWAVWNDIHIEGADRWNRSRYMGKSNFDETCPQYWEIRHPHPSNQIGLARKDDEIDRIDQWILTGEGRAIDSRGNTRRGRLWTSEAVGLYWDPENRTVSLFVDNEYRGVLWRDIPEGFVPTINLWPRTGQLGRRRQDVSALRALCRKRVTDLVAKESTIRKLPLPEIVRTDLEENVFAAWKSRRHLGYP